MATYINNIFNFGRSLPSPFDTIANKKIKVSSKYGDGTTSTLCGTVIKAVHAVCHCMDGSGEGAVGIIDHRHGGQSINPLPVRMPIILWCTIATPAA